jgi:hypothetical protein
VREYIPVQDANQTICCAFDGRQLKLGRMHRFVHMLHSLTYRAHHFTKTTFANFDKDRCYLKEFNRIFINIRSSLTLTFAVVFHLLLPMSTILMGRCATFDLALKELSFASAYIKILVMFMIFSQGRNKIEVL